MDDFICILVEEEIFFFIELSIFDLILEISFNF